MRNIVERHFKKTGSEKAESVLDNWDEEVGKLWQVHPLSEASWAVVAETIVGDAVKVSAVAPSEGFFYLHVGAGMNPDQSTRCADLKMGFIQNGGRYCIASTHEHVLG